MKKEKNLETLLNFILGVVWVFLLIGTLFIFTFSISMMSFQFAILLAFLFFVLASSMIIFLESYKVNLKKYEESKLQTQILKNIEKKLSETSNTSDKSEIFNK
jgi:glucan phosphoethanolaminetransferase (alkaline phosphatase superfamily)